MTNDDHNHCGKLVQRKFIAFEVIQTLYTSISFIQMVLGNEREKMFDFVFLNTESFDLQGQPVLDYIDRDLRLVHI